MSPTQAAGLASAGGEGVAGATSNRAENGRAASNPPPGKSYSHLTSVSAALAIRELDAALRSPKSRVKDLSVDARNGLGGSSDSSRSSAPNAIMKVSEVEDPTRIAAERAVLQERIDRRQRVHPKVYQELMSRSPKKRTTSKEASPGKRRKIQATAEAAGAGKSQAAPVEAYAPFSLPHLLKRLATYTISNYSLFKRAKFPAYLLHGSPHSETSRKQEAQWKAWLQEEVDPVRAARHGWYVPTSGATGLAERETLRCGACKTTWSVEEWIRLHASEAFQAWSAAELAREQQDRELGVALAPPLLERVLSVLTARHKEWCAWRVRSCEPQLYNLPAQSRPDLLQELLLKTTRFALYVRDLEASGRAVASLIQRPAAVEEIELDELLSALKDEDRRQQRVAAAAATGQLMSQSEAEDLDTMSAKEGALQGLCGWDLVELPSSSGGGTAAAAPQREWALECSMCMRRVGLWTFLQDPNSERQRRMDVIKEHRDFCAFVVPPSLLPKDAAQSAAGTGLSSVATSLQQGNKLVGWQVRLQIALGKMIPRGHGASPRDDENSITSASAESLKNMKPGELLRQMRAVLES